MKYGDRRNLALTGRTGYVPFGNVTVKKLHMKKHDNYVGNAEHIPTR